MKNVLNTFCFLYFLMFGMINLAYSQIEVKIKHGPKGERNMLDAEGKKQGTWKFYNTFGVLVRSIDYVNGKPDGVTTIYYSNSVDESKVREEINYFDGKKDGSYQRNYFSGESAVTGEYVYGKKDGTWTFYHDNGEVKRECNYSKGVKHGAWKSYNKKGELLSDKNYKNGVDESAPKDPPKPVAPPKGKPGAKPTSGTPAAAPATAPATANPTDATPTPAATPAETKP